MTEVGTLEEIWRYPVKGMAGEMLDRSAIGARGVAGDRLWALRDSARAEIQSCKTRPDLLRCRAVLRDDDSGAVDVTLPDGRMLGSDAPDAHAALSALVGRESTLEALRPASDYDFFRRHKRDAHTWLEELAATFEREPGEPLPALDELPPELVDCVAVPGTFFLVTPLHLVTSATLVHLRRLKPDADWDRRRFRPNLMVATVPGLDGLVEQDWIGRRLHVGAAVFDCVGATPRCGAITRPQQGLAQDSGMLRTVVRDAAQNVGIYLMNVVAAEVGVGDRVLLE
ncbi:MAG: MOSC N-terminal beta barrel domain-containing protein [Gammaproteobacteria bacterium]